MKQKLLILGATGFIGRNMVECFAANPAYEVHATRFNSPHPDIPNVKWHKADLRVPSYFPNLFRGVDIIIQAAATTSGSKDIVNNPSLHVTDNAVMNSYIFRAAAEAKVKHVIFFSCTVMYPDGVCTEETPVDPHSKYFGVAHTKLYIEKLAEFYSRVGDTKFTVIRHSNIYGPHDKFDLEKSHVFGAMLTKVMQCREPKDKHETVTVWGTGEEKRDLLHVSDLCDFVSLALENQDSKFGLYNCGSGDAVSINDLVAKMLLYVDKDIYIEHDLLAPTIPTSLSLDCAKAKNELGWNAKVTLPEGIKRTIEWWKENYG